MVQARKPRHLQLAFLVLAAAAGAIGLLLPVIDAPDQLKLIELSFPLAAVVYAVAGAWFALVYPEVSQEADEADQHSTGERASRLTRPMYVATGVLCCDTILALCLSIGPRVFGSTAAHNWSLRLSLAMITLMSLLNIVSLLMLVPTAVHVRAALERRIRSKNYLRGLRHEKSYVAASSEPDVPPTDGPKNRGSSVRRQAQVTAK